MRWENRLVDCLGHCPRSQNGGGDQSVSACREVCEEVIVLILCIFHNISTADSKQGGFKFQVQRVKDGAIAHRLPGAWQSRDISSGAYSGDVR